MSWAGCYDLTLTCDSKEHVLQCVRQFTDEKGSACRRRARLLGWFFNERGDCFCPAHNPRFKRKRKPTTKRGGLANFAEQTEGYMNAIRPGGRR